MLPRRKEYTMQIFLKLTLLITIVAGMLLPCRLWAFFGSSPEIYPTLAELTDAIASEMKSEFKGRRLYMDRNEIRDDSDGATSPFSGMLANQLERALGSAGFVFEGGTQDVAQSEAERQSAALKADLAEYRVTATYSRNGNNVQVQIRVRDNRQGTIRPLGKSYIIAAASVPGAFEDTLENRLKRLTGKLATALQRQEPLLVFAPPILESRKKYPSPFSEYVTNRLKMLLPERASVRIIDDTPEIQKLVANRVVKRTALESSSGGADALLEGSYLRSMRKTINLSVALKDAEGRVLARAEEELPLALITYSLENSTAETLAQITDIEHEQGNSPVSISTVKGDNYQIFREGEVVSFRLRVAKPLYVYVYSINSKAEAGLLYPREGAPEAPKTPGITYTLPDSSDNWEIRVTPPFGADAVKVFASDRRLPLPTLSVTAPSRSFSGGTRGLTRVDAVRKELATQRIISGYDLVDWYKGIAARAGGPLYEATVYVETRGR